jgi:hypothetical protein
MLAYYIFLASLIAILGISSYSYEKINTVTSDSEVSQKLVLSTLIIASISIFFSFFLRFINYISYERGSNMLSFGVLVTSILLMLSYAYLDKERKSGSEYDALKTQIDQVENNTNSNERDMSLIMGVVGLSIVGAYLFIIIGKVFYSKKINTTITIKEPLIIQPVDDKPVEIDYESLRKKFVV